MAKIRRSDMPQPAAAGLTERGQQTPAPTQPRHEAPSAPAPKAKRRRSSIGYTVAMIFFGAVFLVSAGLLVKRFLDDRKTENEFASLQAMIDTTATTDTQDPTGENVNPNGAKFAALRDKNSDFIGWISIDGTNLDFNKEYSIYGVPYLDEKTTLGANAESDNLIIYGHNMKTGTIFGCLTGYKKVDYYQQHPYIEFDTVYGDAQYEVFAAFAIDVVNDTSFVYNQYVDMDEESYNAYVEEVCRRSDVDTGIRPAYGEQLLTLSTCEYSTDNGRFVVVARRVAA